MHRYHKLEPTLLREAYISTRFALLANFKVLWVSSILLDAGVTVHISWNFHITRNFNAVPIHRQSNSAGTKCKKETRIPIPN